MWSLYRSHLDFDEEIVVFFLGDHDRVNLACFRVSQWLRAVLEHLLHKAALTVFELVVLRLYYFADYDVVAAYLLAWTHETILVQFVVWPML